MWSDLQLSVFMRENVNADNQQTGRVIINKLETRKIRIYNMEGLIKNVRRHLQLTFMMKEKILMDSV
jgi:hypothetical protein